MEDLKLQQIREKYDEYKEVLAAIELGDHKVMAETTIEQALMMKQIVTTLEDMGFHLVVRRIN